MIAETKKMFLKIYQSPLVDKYMFAIAVGLSEPVRPMLAAISPRGRMAAM